MIPGDHGVQALTIYVRTRTSGGGGHCSRPLEGAWALTGRLAWPPLRRLGQLRTRASSLPPPGVQTAPCPGGLGRLICAVWGLPSGLLESSRAAPGAPPTRATIGGGFPCTNVVSTGWHGPPPASDATAAGGTFSCPSTTEHVGCAPHCFGNC